MAIQSLSPSSVSIPDHSTRYPQVGKNRNQDLAADASGRQASPYTRSVGLSSEYYSSDTLSLSYSNKDGDTVTLSMQHIEYAKAQISIQDNGSTSDADWQKIVDKIKDEYKKLQGQIVEGFIKSMGGTVNEETDATGTETVEEAQVPEYWNAENTSQRIVDFATSLFQGFDGAGSDFMNMIKDAIKAGFDQAKDILGDLPGPVSKLVNHTYDLVMKKLDAWQEAQGISAAEPAVAA